MVVYLSLTDRLFKGSIMKSNIEIIRTSEEQNSRKTIVFLNSLASNSDIWKTYKNYYKSKFNIINVNYPGFGRAKYKAMDKIEDLSELIIDELQEYMVGDVYIIGYSLGSWVAQNVASYYKQIKGLVLIGTSHHVLVHGRLIADHWLKLLEENGVERFVENLSLWSFSSETYEEIDRVGLYLQHSALKSFNDYHAITDQVNMIKNYNNGSRVEDFQFPVLIIRGEDDLLYPAFSATNLGKMIPDSSIRSIAKAGHSVILEKPKEVIKCIDEFFNRIEE
jgi:pimeloyl-ACP methyl ester carboxylesterase